VRGRRVQATPRVRWEPPAKRGSRQPPPRAPVTRDLSRYRAQARTTRCVLRGRSAPPSLPPRMWRLSVQPPTAWPSQPPPPHAHAQSSSHARVLPLFPPHRGDPGTVQDGMFHELNHAKFGWFHVRPRLAGGQQGPTTHSQGRHAHAALLCAGVGVAASRARWGCRPASQHAAARTPWHAHEQLPLGTGPSLDARSRDARWRGPFPPSLKLKPQVKAILISGVG
jgi:hypothetical protein